MGADFTPTFEGYSNQGTFRFWCQKVLPLVYDDSLSYYEILCKVVNYLNNTIADVKAVEDNVDALLTAYNELQDYVNHYFDSLDIQTEINNKLDAMARSGELDEIIAPHIPAIVTEWLEDNITPTTPIVDKTLSIEDAAADAKVTGDRIGMSDTRGKNNRNALFFESIDASNEEYWEQGGIRTDGTDAASSTESIRIRSTYIKIKPECEIVSVSVTGLYYALYFYDSNKYLVQAYSNMTNVDSEYLVPSETEYMRVTCKYNNDAEIDISASSNVAIVFNAPMTNAVQKIRDYDFINLSNENSWEQGGIRNDGTNAASSTNTIRIRSLYIEISTNELDVYMLSDDDYEYYIYFYDSQKALVSSPAAWGHGLNIYEIPSSTKYIRACVRNRADPTATIDKSEGENVGIIVYYPVLARISRISSQINAVGNSAYYGNRINLNPLATARSWCNVNKVFEIDNVEAPQYGSYNFWRNQSVAYYGNYIFVFLSNGNCIVMNKTNMTVVSEFVILNDHNHQNSAQFTNIFYDNNDEFPLVAVSRFGEKMYEQGGSYYPDTCQMIRIQREGTTFTRTIVSRISCDLDSYGISWIIDNNTNKLTAMAYLGGRYSVTSQPISFYTWNMPSKATILAGNISLEVADCINHFETQFFLIQDTYGFNEKAFCATEINGNKGFILVNLASGEIENIIPVSGLHEAEGIYVVDKVVYLFNRDGSNIDYQYPMAIYTIEF